MCDFSPKISFLQLQSFFAVQSSDASGGASSSSTASSAAMDKRALFADTSRKTASLSLSTGVFSCLFRILSLETHLCSSCASAFDKSKSTSSVQDLTSDQLDDLSEALMSASLPGLEGYVLPWLPDRFALSLIFLAAETEPSNSNWLLCFQLIVTTRKNLEPSTMPLCDSWYLSADFSANCIFFSNQLVSFVSTVGKQNLQEHVTLP